MMSGQLGRQKSCHAWFAGQSANAINGFEDGSNSPGGRKGNRLRHGRQIGEGAITGSGSVVTRDVEPYMIVVGVPARVLRKRERKTGGEQESK